MQLTPTHIDTKTLLKHYEFEQSHFSLFRRHREIKKHRVIQFSPVTWVAIYTQSKSIAIAVATFSFSTKGLKKPYHSQRLKICIKLYIYPTGILDV